MKLGIINGNGFSSTGGASIQEGYSLLGHYYEDIIVYHFIQSDTVTCCTLLGDGLVDEKTGSKIDNVILYNHFVSDCGLEKQLATMDKVIVLSFPTISPIFPNCNIVVDFYTRVLEDYKHTGKFLGGVWYHYDKDIISEYPIELYSLVDCMWVNNSHNPIVSILCNINNGLQFHFECPQFINPHGIVSEEPIRKCIT